MTKKDYERIARIVKESQPPGGTSWELDRFARAFASEEGRVNLRFDADRFIAACGVTP